MSILTYFSKKHVSSKVDPSQYIVTGFHNDGIDGSDEQATPQQAPLTATRG